MNPVFAISDLHLADRGPRDNFAVGNRERRFYDFLDYVDDNRGKLIILGDLFDWWQVNLSQSAQAYCNLTARLSCVGPNGARWIVGNHDSALTGFINNRVSLPGLALAPTPAFETTIGNKRFAFLHGHETDSYCRDLNPGVGEITAIMSALLEDRNKGPIHNGVSVEDTFINSLEMPLNLWRRLTRQAKRLDEMIDGVEAYRKEKQADVVVSGHTHIPGQMGDYHFNTGSWCRDEDTFVRIEDGAVSLWQWTDRPVPFNKLLR